MRAYYRRGLIFVQRLFAINSDPRRDFRGVKRPNDPRPTRDSAAATIVPSSRGHVPLGGR